MKKIVLNKNASIPILGFGTWELIGHACTEAVANALSVGYRHIDTADAYGNHSEVAKGIKKSRIKREDIFLTTKVFHPNLAGENVRACCERFLDELNTDYLDLLLIHWPNRTIPISETLNVMNELKKEGKIRAIGVSNFTIHHLRDAIATGTEICNNQIELHPSFNQKELREFADSAKITLTAYSPLARGRDLNLPVILELAEKYHVTGSQVVLNWIMQKNIVAIPKSATIARTEDNFKATTWKLATEDIEKIDRLPQKNRMVNPSFNEFDY